VPMAMFLGGKMTGLRLPTEGIPGSRGEDLGVGVEMTMKEWMLTAEERGSSGGGQKRKIRNGGCTLCQGG
jgi:hypothetical protein